MWKHAWVDDVSQLQTRWEGIRLSNESGLGLVAQGTRDWKNFAVASRIVPLLAEAWGLAARVQGRERYYALMFDRRDGGSIRLVRRRHREFILATRKFPWKFDQAYDLVLRVEDGQISASIDGTVLLQVEDRSVDALDAGGVALIVDTGSIATEAVRVSPL